MMPARAADVVRDGAGVRIALDDGRLIGAPLLIGAEGRNSPTREAANIPLARWNYDHAAIIATVNHERSHENVAYEIFYPAGPFAILPMLAAPDGKPRSAIVWSVKAARCARDPRPARPRAGGRDREKDGRLPRPGHARRAALRATSSASTTPRRSPPSGSLWSATPRTASIRSRARGSISASATPPRLTQVLVEGARLGLDLGDAQLLARYERWRSLDTFMVAAATDALTRLYGVPGKAASAVRRFGMGAVQRIGPLKNRLMAEARGETGDLPLLLRGLADLKAGALPRPA